jgi:hypothetical protein
VNYSRVTLQAIQATRHHWIRSRTGAHGPVPLLPGTFCLHSMWNPLTSACVWIVWELLVVGKAGSLEPVLRWVEPNY